MPALYDEPLASQYFALTRMHPDACSLSSPEQLALLIG
jgi:hypothetical protein